MSETAPSFDASDYVTDPALKAYFQSLLSGRGKRAPQNVGEGFNAIGENIREAVMFNQARSDRQAQMAAEGRGYSAQLASLPGIVGQSRPAPSYRGPVDGPPPMRPYTPPPQFPQGAPNARPAIMDQGQSMPPSGAQFANPGQPAIAQGHFAGAPTSEQMPLPKPQPTLQPMPEQGAGRFAAPRLAQSTAFKDYDIGTIDETPPGQPSNQNDGVTAVPMDANGMTAPGMSPINEALGRVGGAHGYDMSEEAGHPYKADPKEQLKKRMNLGGPKPQEQSALQNNVPDLQVPSQMPPAIARGFQQQPQALPANGATSGAANAPFKPQLTHDSVELEAAHANTLHGEYNRLRALVDNQSLPTTQRRELFLKAQQIGEQIRDLNSPKANMERYLQSLKIKEQEQKIQAEQSKLQKYGTDILGQEQYGVFDPVTKTIIPAEQIVGGRGGVAIDGSGGGGNAATSAKAAMTSGANGEDFLKQLDPTLANELRAYRDGRLQHPTGAATFKPGWRAMEKLLMQADPNYDAINYASRAATRKDFTAGKSAANLSSFNTSLRHLVNLANKAEALDNWNVPGGSWARHVTNPIAAGLSPDYESRRAQFQGAKTAAVEELTRAFRGSGGSVHDIIEWSKGLDENMSGKALRDSVANMTHMLMDRVHSVGEQYNRGMGTTKDPIELLAPESKRLVETLLGQGAADGHGSQSAQSGHSQARPPSAPNSGLQKPASPKDAALQSGSKMSPAELKREALELVRSGRLLREAAIKRLRELNVDVGGPLRWQAALSMTCLKLVPPRAAKVALAHLRIYWMEKPTVSTLFAALPLMPMLSAKADWISLNPMRPSENKS